MSESYVGVGTGGGLGVGHHQRAGMGDLWDPSITVCGAQDPVPIYLPGRSRANFRREKKRQERGAQMLHVGGGGRSRCSEWLSFRKSPSHAAVRVVRPHCVVSAGFV